MLLELYAPAATPDSNAAFTVFLAFADVHLGHPTPSAWTAQLAALAASELDLPANLHMLDRAVGVGALLDTVRVEVLKDDASNQHSARVLCRLVDSCSVEWTVRREGSEDARRFLSALEGILKGVEAMRVEEENFEMAVEYEEQQRMLVRQRSRHQHSLSLEPASVGRKPTHKRQKSFLQSIVSAVGSMMLQRPSRSILPTNNDYPFPVSPSPSPPLSPPYTDSRTGTPSPENASVANQHGHHPHTYTYGAQHSSPLPPIPWTTTPLEPPSPSALHQARVKEHHDLIRSGIIDTYRRFILSALVYGFAKEVGLATDEASLFPQSGNTSGSATLAGSPQQSEGTVVSEDLGGFAFAPRPASLSAFPPYTGPPRASSNAPTTYNYRLWVLRSILRSTEAEVREIVEACKAAVREDFARAQTQFEEDEVDISDGNIDVSDLDGPPRSAATYSFTLPPTPATSSFSPKTKVSFDSGDSPTKNGEKVLAKKKSKGKLVKKKSLVWRSEGKEKTERNVLGMLGSWGRSKTNVTSTSAPVAPIPEVHSMEVVPSDGTTEDGGSVSSHDPSLLSPDGDRAEYASRRESSSSSGCTTATTESGCSTGTTETALTTPATSVVELPKTDGATAEGEEEELDIGADVVYSGSSPSRSTLNILDQLDPAAASSSSLLLPIGGSTTDVSRSVLPDTPAQNAPPSIPDVDTPDFQLNLRMRLNLHPAYSRLTHRLSKLREVLAYAEAERRDAREEEERYLDVLEVRSRRRAWSNAALGRSSSQSGGALNLNSDMMLLGLSAPFRSSGLAASPTGRTSEDLEKEGWVYVAPPSPHPLFHGVGGFEAVGGMAFPKFAPLEGETPGLSSRMMRKVDIRVRVERERERERRRLEGLDGALDSENAFGIGSRGLVDDREDEEDDGLEMDDSGIGSQGVVEFCIDASWNTESAMGDSDDELDVDDDIFAGPRHDLANIPPRPGMRPTKNHPPPSRLVAVAEEDEVDELDGLNSAGTATETETEGETEGEGDEFEFDNVPGSRTAPRRLQPRDVTNLSGSVDESEDEDETFYAEYHQLTEIVGDIEDGLGRHQRYPRRPHRRSSQRGSSSNLSSKRAELRRSHELHRGVDIVVLDEIGNSSPGYPLESFDVDVEMGLGAGETLRETSLEFQHGASQGNRRPSKSPSRKSVKGRPRTPYPLDDEESEEGAKESAHEAGQDALHPDAASSRRKRPRNHKRQWQNMLSPGSSKHEPPHATPEDTSRGIEIALEAEKPKPRFMPAMKKAIMGRTSKSRRTAEAPSSEPPSNAEPVSPDTPPAGMLHPNGAPRARTSSMYHRQPSPNSRAGLAAARLSEDGPEVDGAHASGGKGALPLGLGYGYGTYTNAPAAGRKGDSGKGLSESSLLCQPVRFASPPALDSYSSSSASGKPRLATKTLVASPPAFANETERSSRKKGLSLDLDEGASVEHFEDAGYGQFGGESDRSSVATSASSEPWSACSHAGCDSACSSASLPMSPLSPPSPGIKACALEMEVIKRQEQGSVNVEPLQIAVGQWEAPSPVSSDGEEFTLAMEAPQRRVAHHGKKFFHLPSSLAMPKEGAVDVGLAVVKDPSTGSKKAGRKSILSDPAFFEPLPVHGSGAVGGGKEGEPCPVVVGVRAVQESC